MDFQRKRDIVLQTFLCSLFSISMTSQGTDTDIYCLKSIKDSLEDSNNHLSSSWNFNNKTEGFICRFIGDDCWHPDENRVQYLKLSGMGLKGPFPRGLRNFSSMTGLDLSFNELSGTIPSDISTIVTFVTNMDLSNNNFIGEIPVSLANCTYLNTLKLDNNTLSGQIPPQFGLLTRLKMINFANNNLSGPVPAFPIGVDYDYTNNGELCGESLGRPCSVGGPGKFHMSFKDGLIVGYVLSLTCSVMVTCCVQLKEKKKKNTHPNKPTKNLGKYFCSITRSRTRWVANQMHRLQHHLRVEKGSKEISVLLERLTSTILFEELHEATDCFAMDNAIGVGKMGIMMYQGSLPNVQFLAVKRLLDSQLFKRQFLSEVMILGKYRHRNIVPLLGFCIEGKERLLAYAYMSYGRLSKWLHPLESEISRLKWPERINIALGIARGLSWLHHNCDGRGAS